MAATRPLAFARQAHAGLLLVLVPFSVLLMLGMPGVLALLAPGMRDEPTFAMAVEFGRITFPYLLFISLASLYGGVLNSIDRFAHVAGHADPAQSRFDRRGARPSRPCCPTAAMPPRSAWRSRACCNGCGC